MVRIPEIAGVARARRLGEAELMAREYIAVTLDVSLVSVAVVLTIERVGGVDRAARISLFGRDRLEVGSRPLLHRHGPEARPPRTVARIHAAGATHNHGSMPIPRYDDIRTIPLPTDRELIPHLESMLDCALRRQVWLIMLDQQSCPLPIVMPTDVDDEPHPDDVTGFAEMLNCISMDFKAPTVVLTLERPGPAQLVDRDRRWMRVLREACVALGSPFRGPYLLLGDRVQQVPPDDYVGIPLVYSDDDEYDDQGPL